MILSFFISKIKQRHFARIRGGLLVIGFVVALSKNLFAYYICEATDGFCYYASPSGSGDVCSYDNPCSIRTALHKMSAGDYLYLKEGQYNTYYRNYEKWAIINIDNFFNFRDPKPTKQAPVVIKSCPGENVKLVGTEEHKRCIDIESEDNILIEELTFEECNVKIGENGNADNITIRNNTFIHHPAGDNSGAIAGRSSNLSILNNTIIGPGLGADGSHLNTNGIYIARDELNLKVLNNDISNVPIGIYYKHANSERDLNMEIAYNYIHDTDRNAMQVNANYAYIHDNLFGKNNANISVNEANGVPGGDYNRFEYNTFYMCSIGFSSDTQSGDPLPYAVGNMFWSNIVLNDRSPLTIWPWYSGGEDPCMQIDYNLYYNISSSILVYSRENGYSLAEWQSYYGQDEHSIVDNPHFVNFSGTMSDIRDFMLAPSSPCRGAGKNGKDMGANVLLVGPSPIADINGDREVNISDVQQIVNTILGISASERADINYDGNVTIVDVQLDVNCIVN